MIKGTAIITINCAPDIVFNTVTDVARMGEFSPECTGGRWIAPATGPAEGAAFEGDNVARLGPIPVKKWTTTSTVTTCKPGEVFEFDVGGFTKWRFEFIEIDGATRVTQSFQHEPFAGVQKLLYGKLFKRQPAMVTGMQTTLGKMKTVIEAEQQRASA